MQGGPAHSSGGARPLRAAAQCATTFGVKAQSGSGVAAGTAESSEELATMNTATREVGGGSVAWKPRESPEVQLLLACARSQMSGEAEQCVRELAAQPLDWPYIFRWAMRHELGLVLHHHTSRLCPERVPGEIADHLCELTTKSRAWNERLVADGARAFEVLQAAGTPALAYYELSMADRLSCGPHTLRQMNAADILIAASDVDRAKQALRNAGFTARGGGTGDGYGIDAHFYQWFGYGEAISTVTIYWALARPHAGLKCDFQAFAKRARSTAIAGRQVPALCRDDVLLLASVMCSLNVWSSAKWLADSAETVPEVADWNALEREARRIHAGRIFRLGIFLTSDLLGATLPDEVLSRAAGDTTVQRLAGKAAGRLLNAAPASVDSLYTARAGFHLCDTTRQRIAYVWRMLTLPTEADWKFARLPRSVFSLYGLLRPGRIVWRAFQMSAHRLQRALGWRHKLSGYAPSAMPVVERMLELAELHPGDRLYDLGCGDGRFIIEAAQRYGVRGVGVDLDPKRIAESQQNARAAGVENLVSFVQGDASRIDLSSASVVILYLPAAVQLRLRKKLERELPAGARVVSHGADSGDWTRAEIVDYQGYPATIYLWKKSNGNM